MLEKDRNLKPVAGSYRDPAGHVYEYDGRIFRTVFDLGLRDYRFCQHSKFLEEAQAQGYLVPTKIVTDPDILAFFLDAPLVLEHERIPFISFPYEWTFAQLKKAAIFHLELNLMALEFGVAMRDSSAYNVQFNGTSPVFIDHLSFAPYEEGKLWAGHHQFCEEFLNPLLLCAKSDLNFQSWYRGTLFGISTKDTNRILPWLAKFSPQVFLHVVLKNWLDEWSTTDTSATTLDSPPNKIKWEGSNKLSKRGLVAMLSKLLSFVANLEDNSSKTLWQDYSESNSYDVESSETKRLFVQDLCSRNKPNRVLDVGCNTAEFSEVALLNGSVQAVGLDLDHGAMTKAWCRAETKSLSFLPLIQDLQNLSPAQGWNGLERQSLRERISQWKPNAVLGLAIVHHLALGKNIPLGQILDWLTGIAPHGIIEFVPKTDRTVQVMLRHREDIFPTYTQPNFEALLEDRGRIVNRAELPNGRVLYQFCR